MRDTSPDSLTALIQAGLESLQAGDTAAALPRFAAARRLAPAEPGLLSTLTLLYRQDGQWGAAWSAAETGLAVQPTDAGLRAARHAALGGLLLQAGANAEAAPHFAAALAINPDWPEILGLAAEAAYRGDALAEARTHLDRALTLEPDSRSLHMARATMLLSQGIWDPGLADYEYRLRPDAAGRRLERRGLSAPRWTGADLAGGSLLVVAEQAVGDQMRFARDLAAIRPLCGRLIVECEGRLVPLFARSLGDAVVRPSVESRDGPRHVFDYGWLAPLEPVAAWIEIGSLALRLFERGQAPDRA